MTGLEHYVGHVIDEKYRLERLLGRGGMGAVYLATHLGTARYVAVKLITPQFMANEEFVERFKREARAAGRLRHPNVVDVTDFGFGEVSNEPVAYLVMEYLDGCTLGDVLAEEDRLPLEWVVDILEQVCSAVHEAHEQGIVHRDLKPDNIWLEPNRLGGYRVKVLDFGIAKLSETEFRVGDDATQNQLRPFAGGFTGSGLSARLTHVPVDPSLETDTLLYSDGEQGALISGGNEPSALQEQPDGAAEAAQAESARETHIYSRQTVSTQAFASAAPTVAPLSAVAGSTAAQPASAARQNSEPDLEDGTLMLEKATRRVGSGPRTTLSGGTS